MQVQTKIGEIRISEYPDKCPYCHHSITPNPIYGYIFNTYLEILMACPNSQCNHSFIAYYNLNNGYNYGHYQGYTSQGNILKKEFPEGINNISSNFSIIYNQAYFAEQQGLTEICGVGYRKAIEFLIKDYSILNRSEDKEKIEKMSLANVIETYVNDAKIKSVSKRAVWLGNDETHYVKKWEGRNLTDLKNLITLILHWIEMETLTKSFEEEMPG